ncbi:MAG TPA: TIGR04053 family radical SAM/SPASM domain-containing protein, partial [bacterium]
MAIWEVTRACDLACRHCRADAQERRDPLELNTEQALALIGQIADWKVPLFVLTGGDCLKRDDLMILVGECSRRGILFGLAPSVTPLLTREKLSELKKAGVHRLSISLDGADAQTHDEFRGIPGTFQRTMEVLEDIRDLKIEVQINTSVGKHNFHQLPAMAELLRPFNIQMWSTFFLVPTGRATRELLLTASQTEQALEFLYETLEKGWFDVKTTEAPHFRRVILQKMGVDPDDIGKAIARCSRPGLLRAARGVNDGRGFVFISHRGDVYPSGFLPIMGGNLKQKSLAEIYQNSWLFKLMRNSDLFEGKCGFCEYRHLCGGSRSRAYAMTGSPIASDPLCSYQPKTSKWASSVA